MVFLNKVTDDVARTVVDASSHWRDDQVACWKQAYAEEEIPHAKWAMENFIKNAAVADKKHCALCDDTGTPHPFLEIGDEASLPAGFLEAMEDAWRRTRDQEQNPGFISHAFSGTCS